jgi:hypothetical protein
MKLLRERHFLNESARCTCWVDGLLACPATTAVIDFVLSWLFIVDVGPSLGPFHLVDVGSVADIWRFMAPPALWWK